MGIETVVALVASGAGVSAALTATYGVIGGALISVAASTLLTAGINALTGGVGSQADARARISVQTELPYQRHVRGRCFATGTPLPGVADDGFYYVPYLINSRPSEGNIELYLDDRIVEFTGDPYDFTGPGAVATNGRFNTRLNYWIQLGDETGPPDVFLNEVPYHADDRPLGFKATDAGRGLTVIWVRARRGGEGKISITWPSYPQIRLTALGDWSKVWDPSDPAQTATDTSTHTFSRSHALHALDLVMRNPFRPYAESLIELDMFKACAAVDAEPVPLKSGGSEPRYQCDGTTLFDGSELEGLMQPITSAGASNIVRSGGLLGIVPGVAKNVVTTITSADLVDALPRFSSVSTPESQYDQVQVTYYPTDRFGKTANLKNWGIPGVIPTGLPRVLSLDLGMVGSATQAMRIRKIKGLQTTYTRTLAGTAMPKLIEAVAGSWVGAGFGYPKLDGTYEVASTTPLASPLGGDGGVAYRIPFEFREASDLIYEWDGIAEEEDVDNYDYDFLDDGVASPGPISIITGDTVNLNTGGTIIPRVRYSAAASPSSNVSSYQWESAEQGEPYGNRNSVDADQLDAGGNSFGFLSGSAGQPYNIRVRAVVAESASDWVEFSGAVPTVDITLDAPTINSLTGGAGLIDVDVSAPNDADVRRIEILEGDTNDINAADAFYEAAASANQRFQNALTGLGPSESKFIFVRVRGDFASASIPITGSATTNA